MGLLRPEYMIYSQDLDDTKMYKDLCMKLYLNMLQILNFQKVLSENKEFTPASQITYI